MRPWNRIGSGAIGSAESRALRPDNSSGAGDWGVLVDPLQQRRERAS
jgi:hypothetical protein